MQFRVGPFRYSVRIEQHLFNSAGEACTGLFRESSREIAISDECPPRERMVVLLHELTHAWICATSRPRGVEGMCNLVGTILSSVLIDLQIQGGNEALMRLGIGESPEQKAAALVLTRNRYCRSCQGTVAGASVVCGPSRLPGVLNLSLYCEHCNHVQHWKEAAATSGLPSGSVVGKPRFEKGVAVARFLAMHPEAAGLIASASS